MNDVYRQFLSDTTMSQVAPYGKWESTITPESIVQGVSSFRQHYKNGSVTGWLQSISFSDVFVDPTNDKIYHIEARPEDNARNVIVDTISGQDVIPSPYNARTSVQEYGGAAAIAYNGTLYFSNISDNRVYSIKAAISQTPEPVTPGNPG